jgi:hypothetical protein
MSESECKLVSSRGIMKSCDIFSSNPISSVTKIIGYDFSKLKPNDSIYICTTALPDFITFFFNKINVPFILVTGDCDLNCPPDIFRSPSEFLKFIHSDKIIHWYSQNCVVKHPKLTPIPIGLDYHTLTIRDHAWGQTATPIQQENLLLEIALLAKPTNERTMLCYSNFHFFMTSRYGNDRTDAKDKIPSECIYYEPTSLKRADTWKNQSNYAFVVSPKGNGIDCHRTWEALALGCIPIIKTSPLNSLFDGLPVWIVEKWEDVTSESMKQKLIEYGNRFLVQNSRIALSYWKTIIRSQASPPFI